MRVKVKSASVLISVCISVAGLVSPAMASTESASTGIKLASAQACSNLSTKIDTHISKIETSLGKQTTTYEKQDSKVTQLINRAKVANVDTAKAESDLATWVSKTNQIKTLKNDLITDLTNLKSLQCADQKTQFKQVLADAKVTLSEIKNLQAEKRSFFAGTLKVDLQEISSSLKAK